MPRHGGLANGQAGLKAAHVGKSWTYSYPPHTTVTYLHAELVPVIITPRKAKVGQVIA